MDTIWQALCVFCAVQTTAPAPQISREAGDISYTHAKLSNGRHLLRLSVTDFWIVGWNEAREERMAAFAHKVAAAVGFDGKAAVAQMLDVAEHAACAHAELAGEARGGDAGSVAQHAGEEVEAVDALHVWRLPGSKRTIR